MHVLVMGRRWRFLRCSEQSIGGNLGLCDHPTEEGKRIRVSRDLVDREELEVIVHELLHAVDWSKDDDWVERAAADMARVLWRLGYRRG